MTVRVRPFWASAVLALLVASPAAALTAFNDLVVFGDSLMDAGNILVLTGGAVPSAASGYYDGRFSNGPVAADVLNQAVEGTLSSPSLLGGDNYAYGGARAIADADSIPDLASQVSSYLADTGGTVDSHTLYLFNIGGNDVRDIVLGADAATRIAAAVSAVVSQVSVLSSLGAQHFLVAGVGDVGATPETIALGPAAQLVGRLASEDMSDALFAALPASVAKVDVIALFDAASADPSGVRAAGRDQPDERLSRLGISGSERPADLHRLRVLRHDPPDHAGLRASRRCVHRGGA